MFIGYYLKLASYTENDIYFSILHEILPNILLLYSEHLTPSADPSDNNKDTKEIALLSPTKRKNSTNSLGIKLNLLHDKRPHNRVYYVSSLNYTACPMIYIIN